MKNREKDDFPTCSPLADAMFQDYYHGGRYDFLRWAGLNVSQGDEGSPLVQQFYTNATIVGSFKDYITKLLSHVNPHTGLSYAQDPTIFAYETGNEMGETDCPTAWIAEIGRHVKALAPNKLLVDGTYGINEDHLAIAEVDIFSDHFYPPILYKLQSDLKLGEKTPPSPSWRSGGALMSGAAQWRR